LSITKESGAVCPRTYSKSAKLVFQIEQSIVLVRGEKVMLDYVLAEMYGVTTKALLQAVRRNRERFPNDFMYQLSFHEFTRLRSQIVTSNGRGGRRRRP
jgi:hypothetical protein